jgi:hypothetical protein
VDAEFIRALKILAIKSVKNPDFDAAYRKICRWYSREFSTPLESVYNLPEETVLQTFFEDYYDEMSKDKERAQELDVIIQQLAKNEEEQDAEEMEDEAWVQEMRREIEAEEEAQKQRQSQKNQAKEQVSPNLKIEEFPESIEINPDEPDQYFDEDE